MAISTSADIFKDKEIDEQMAYEPSRLLDALIEKFQLSNDADLCRLLEIGAPVISKIRHRRMPITPSLLIRMHDVSGLSIDELRAIIGESSNGKGSSDRQLKPVEIDDSTGQLMMANSAPVRAGKTRNAPVNHDPSRLFDTLVDQFQLKNDVELSRLLGVSPAMISSIRHGRKQVGALLLVRMHEVSGLAIIELRALMGDHGKKFRGGETDF